jgi:hypothetical protein
MKDVLRAYIKEIGQKGLLDEIPPNSRAVPRATLATDPWFQSPKSGSAIGSPRSSAPCRVASNNFIKQVIVQEENMKFSPSIKFQRAMPKNGRDSEQDPLSLLSVFPTLILNFN